MSVPVKCCGQVFYRFHFRACPYKGKVDRGGKWFCKTHDPVEIKAREDKKDAERQAQRDADNARYQASKLVRQRADLCVAACQGLSDEVVKEMQATKRSSLEYFILGGSYDEKS